MHAHDDLMNDWISHIITIEWNNNLKYKRVQKQSLALEVPCFILFLYDVWLNFKKQLSSNQAANVSWVPKAKGIPYSPSSGTH